MNDLHLIKKYLAKYESSKSRGIAFELSFTSYKNLMRAKKCFYTGVTLTEAHNGPQQPMGRTIDRLDCNKGYVHGNVVACCFAANQLKAALENTSIVNKRTLLKIAKYVTPKKQKEPKTKPAETKFISEPGLITLEEVEAQSICGEKYIGHIGDL